MPELNLDEVDTSLTLFGKRLRAPLLISSMTGGAEAAGAINCHLAAAAEQLGVAIAVGSQRAALANGIDCSQFRRRLRHQPNTDGRKAAEKEKKVQSLPLPI